MFLIAGDATRPRNPLSLRHNMFSGFHKKVMFASSVHLDLNLEKAQRYSGQVEHHGARRAGVPHVLASSIDQGIAQIFFELVVFFNLRGRAMKFSKQSIAVVFALFAVFLSLSAGALQARDGDLAPLTFAAAQTPKKQCTNTCRARYHDCLAKKQIPTFECQNVYQDCVRFNCSALQ